MNKKTVFVGVVAFLLGFSSGAIAVYVVIEGRKHPVAITNREIIDEVTAVQRAIAILAKRSGFRVHHCIWARKDDEKSPHTWRVLFQELPPRPEMVIVVELDAYGDEVTDTPTRFP